MFLGAEVMSVLILAQRVGRLQYDGRRICQHWVGRRSSLDVGALRDRLHRDVGGRAVAGVVDLQSGACCGSCSKRRAADWRTRRREARRDGHITTTQDRHNDLSKRAAAETVDDKVDRRVGDDEQVADALVEEERTGARLGVLAEQSDE